MSVFDLMALVVENLARRKGRVALTAVGVIIGTAAVVLLVSLGSGLQQNAASQLGGIGDLTKINVSPNFTEFDPTTGQPLIDAPLNDTAVESFRGIAGVTAVIPQDYLQGWAQMTVDRLEGGGQLLGAGTTDLAELGLRADQGTTELLPGTVVVGYQMPNNFWDPRARPVQEPPPPPDLLNKQITFTLIKYSEDGTEIRKTVRARVAGVLAESRDEADYSIYMPLKEVEAMNVWFTGQRLDRSKVGYNTVIVRAADLEQVLDVADQITAMGFQAWTPQSFVQGINGFYVVLQVVFGGVGAIALLVAAIGIANTMAMAILERTREIGLMKAVGATNRHVLSVFLGESAGIGFLGGLGGVALGWGLGQVVNVFAIAYLAGQAAETGGPPPMVAVATPTWLPLFALIFATVIGLLSGLYPALRAATLSPITALKYE
ncbi:MAG: ABC transporter permease [Ardenticatenaceae bacterium]|nr:ABC transporter permease [Ardenticatenaceae bacterium]